MFVGVSAENRVLFVSKCPVRKGFGGAVKMHEVDAALVPDNPTAHMFDGSVWESLPQFHAAVQRVQAVISFQENHALGVLERGYTARAVKSWSRQEIEAAAWIEDNAAPVRLLATLSERRGVPLAEVVARVQAKVDMSADLAGIVLGDAQAAGDRLDALVELEKAGSLPSDWVEQLADIERTWRKDWPPELQSAIEN